MIDFSCWNFMSAASQRTRYRELEIPEDPLDLCLEILSGTEPRRVNRRVHDHSNESRSAFSTPIGNMEHFSVPDTPPAEPDDSSQSTQYYSSRSENVAAIESTANSPSGTFPTTRRILFHAEAGPLPSSSSTTPQLVDEHSWIDVEITQPHLPDVSTSTRIASLEVDPFRHLQQDNFSPHIPGPTSTPLPPHHSTISSHPYYDNPHESYQHAELDDDRYAELDDDLAELNLDRDALISPLSARTFHDDFRSQDIHRVELRHFNSNLDFGDGGGGGGSSSSTNNFVASNHRHYNAHINTSMGDSHGGMEYDDSWAGGEEAMFAGLSAQQREIMDAVANGCSVFYTGSAGTGKSHVTRHIIRFLKARYREKYSQCVAVTASTGMAASLIEGTTLNSAMGIGVPVKEEDFGRMYRKDGNGDISIRKLEVLVIDEVSMLSGEFFDYLDDTIREVRRCSRPFGGIQLVICGDFRQLSPVNNKISQHQLSALNVPHMKATKQPLLLPATLQNGTQSRARDQCLVLNRGYAFQSKAWWEANLIFFELTTPFRQSDVEFVDCLNAIRERTYTFHHLNLLRACCRPLQPSDPTRLPIKLFPRNLEAYDENRARLAELPGKPKLYMSDDYTAVFSEDLPRGMSHQAVHEELSKRGKGCFWTACMAKESVELKLDARVLLVYNVDSPDYVPENQRLVNGSQGIVIGFRSREECLDTELREAGERSCEGETIGNSCAACSSRCQDGFRASLCFQNSDAEEFALYADGQRKKLISNWLKQGGADLPLVRFDNQREVVVLPTLFRSETVARGACYRVQIPLVLGWAISIHKSQGMSLSAASVSLQDCFAAGQAYVALSRVSSLAGLEVLDGGISQTVFKHSVAVTRFYNEMRVRRGEGTIRTPEETLRLMKCWRDIAPEVLSLALELHTSFCFDF